VRTEGTGIIQPIHPLSWEILSAVLTSTIFAYGLEINGSASMGAGALEAPTSKLRSYPVFDPRPLSPQDKKALLKLAASVWSAEKPPDWAAEGTQPGPKLRALDEWLLTQTGTNIKADQLYSDLRATCAARIAVAHDKVTTTKSEKPHKPACRHFSPGSDSFASAWTRPLPSPLWEPDTKTNCGRRYTKPSAFTLSSATPSFPV
jgi:hypothetical protein